jgi:hypothetical protein
MLTPQQRIGQDLWPNHRKFLVRRAFEATEGQTVNLSLGEAETVATRETNREIANRLRLLEEADPSQRRPTKKPHPNYCDILID